MNCGMCRDCKHWEPILSDGLSSEYGECEIVATMAGKQLCRLTPVAEFDAITLVTLPTFGCVQFEANCAAAEKLPAQEPEYVWL